MYALMCKVKFCYCIIKNTKQILAEYFLPHEILKKKHVNTLNSKALVVNNEGQDEEPKLVLNVFIA